MPYANQLGNKYNKSAEKVDIHDKRIKDFQEQDIDKFLKVSDNLEIEVSNVPVPEPSSALPLIDGVADPGSLNTWARGDHIHPTDISRAPINSPAFIGNPTAPSPTSSNSISTKEYVDTMIQQHGGGVNTASATLGTSATSAQVSFSGIYLSTTIIDNVTKEEVICDVIHGNGNVTVNVAEPPENQLNITVVYIVT